MAVIQQFLCDAFIPLTYLGTLFATKLVFQAEDGIRDAQESRGLGDVYKRQVSHTSEQMPANADSDRLSSLELRTIQRY